MSSHVFLAALAAVMIGLGVAGPACSSPPPPSHPEMTYGREQQAIVDRAAQGVQVMREDARLEARMEPLLARAQAVLVFPRLIKASILFGGEGGNGVMVVRGPDGSWNGPAFYSLGAASAGFQIGYQETSVVFLLMNQRTVNSALGSKFRLGTDASVVAADLGDEGHVTRKTMTADIYQFAQSGGVFAGVSLDGFVVTPRTRFNDEYYGARLSVRDILIDGQADRPESHVLKDALKLEAPAPSGSAPSGEPAPPAPAPPSAASETAAPRSCSPESRQAEMCAQLYQPVCADVDTGVRCVRAPCNEARTQKTFSNACEACRGTKTLGYRAGECPAAP